MSVANGGQAVSPLERRLRGAAVCGGLALWAFYLVRPSTLFAGDFPQFYVLARLVAAGRLSDLHDASALSQAVKDFVSPDIEWTLLPVYPPQVSLLLAPLGRLPYETAETVWLLISTCLYAVAVAYLLRACEALRPYRLTASLIALAAPAFFQVQLFGQLSTVALAIAIVGFAAHARGRHFVAGLAFGLLAYKPQYGLAMAVIFGITRAGAVVSGAVVTACGQFALAWAYGGSDWLLAYADAVLAIPAARAVLQSQPHFMQSLLPVALLLPGRIAPLLAYGLASATALTMTWVVWTRPVPMDLKHSALIICGLLISPHVYVYDLVLLVPAYAWLTAWLIRERRQNPLAGRDLDECVALLYVWPVLGPALTYAVRINLGPILMMVVLYRLAQRAAAATTQTQAGSAQDPDGTVAHDPPACAD